MIVSLTLGIVMAVIVGIAVTAIIYFLLRKIKAGQKTGVIVGLILGVVAGVMMVMMAGRVVIVQGEEDYGTFLIYGTPSYEFSNGFALNLDMGSNETYIINDTKNELVVEEYVYTTDYITDYDYSDMLILPLSVTKIPGFKVNYFFNDRPPEEITVSESSGDVIKYWLRTRVSYEDEYGPAYYSSENNSVQVGNVNTSNEPKEKDNEE